MNLRKEDKNLKVYSRPEFIKIGDVVKTTQGPYFSGIITDFYPSGYVYPY